MSRFFVNRPIVAMVLSIIMVLLGLVAMRGLPIAQYPEIVPPMIQVTTTFIGASGRDRLTYAKTSWPPDTMGKVNARDGCRLWRTGSDHPRRLRCCPSAERRHQWQ